VTERQSLHEVVTVYHQQMHPDHLGGTPATIPEELLSFRRMLHDEEVREVAEAWDELEEVDEDSVYFGDAREHPPVEAIGQLLHELADVVIVAYGTAAYIGIDLRDVIDAVMWGEHEEGPAHRARRQSHQAAGLAFRRPRHRRDRLPSRGQCGMSAPVKPIANPARRGDLAVLVRTVHTSFVDKPHEKHTEAVICVVTAVRRNGVVLRVKDNWAYEREPRRDELVHVMGAERVDVQAAYEAGRKHLWPGHDQPKAYDSVDEARAAITPFLRSVSA
jgi:NTP pyrophosphatase (non-canonical NTP hydrolase)